MRSGGSFSHTHIEKPVMYEKCNRLLPGHSVLCVGCGSGEECHELQKMGPSKVVGTDISAGLIEEAKKGFPDIEFYVAKAEDHTQFADASFDVIYSSLVMHYVADWRAALKDFYRILKPGGTFVFSTNHPLRWGMDLLRKPGSRVSTLITGYTVEPKSQRVKVFGEYLNAYMKRDRFMKKIHVELFNRPISQMWHEITESGFEIADMVEPKSVQKDIPANFQGFAKATQKIPYFIIFELRKPL